MTVWKTKTSADTWVSIFCPGVNASIRAFDAIVASGVAPTEINVLARGVEVDQRLVLDSEMNANQLAGASGASSTAPQLSRRLSFDRKFLVDGVWAVGSLFERLSNELGSHEMGALKKALISTGISEAEALRIESTLKDREGVWVGVAVPGSGAPGLSSLLESFKTPASN